MPSLAYQPGVCWGGPSGRSEQRLPSSKVLLHAVSTTLCHPRQFVWQALCRCTAEGPMGVLELTSHVLSDNSCSFSSTLGICIFIFTLKTSISALAGSYLKEDSRAVYRSKGWLFLCVQLVHPYSVQICKSFYLRTVVIVSENVLICVWVCICVVSIWLCR